MKKVNAWLLLFPLSLSVSTATGNDKSEVLAEVQGDQILRSDVDEAAAKALDQLHMERVRFEAQEVYKRHQIIQDALRTLSSNKVLDLESEAKSLSKRELLEKEVDSKIEPPTDEEIDAYYEKNKKRFQGEKEQALPHISKLLERTKKVKARNSYIESLKEKYGVEVYLAPLRLEVSSDGSPSMGPSDAPVTIVEFSDFECPYCSRLAQTIKKVTDDYSDSVRLVFRQFPLQRIHPNAQKAAEAALCAADQGKFWEMHDLLFGDQKKLNASDLKEKADSLDLKADEFAQCLETEKHAETVRDDLYDGVRAGVSGTPALFVNGRPLTGQVPYETLAKIIKEELATSSE